MKSKEEAVAWARRCPASDNEVIVGWGGLTVFLSRDACTYLVLTARDGDPEPR